MRVLIRLTAPAGRMRQGLEALRVPSKAAILSHLNNMGLSAILAHKSATGLKAGRITSRRPARRGRWFNLLLYPPYSFVCSSKANIWISKLLLICFGGGLLIKDCQCSKSSSRPAVFNPAISIPMPLLPLASLTEQSPRAFGHTNTQAYGKTKVQSE